ncbi:conserved hypothetical protein [Vibrio crassostreae]|uniref:Uncharacterized protein n=1 Tax=Photobacterium angustum TaxID=661 RepID=A0ABX5HAG1_PHOAN|nr:hypothetical protein [Photobacterium angustum]CAK2038195.1 conserved hypothetical protein [Vibrio crassostreae]KJG35267.1 hypothetical protein UA32_20965 [Photobacterium angustum]PSX12830.1 hypothetical protein C0W27_02130 [Photobacterium angustum]CAK2171562.1 conserved hypothetical protein [Vibrio crassostreae]CAK2913502.1 conserved hypothetical protein [Vibrio crassostreae]
MSYNIAVVNFPLPEDFAEAVELVNPLTEVELEEVQPIFQEFHDKVTGIYPCLCSLSDDEIDSGVWCDGPLINNFKVKAPVIGFSFSKVEEAFPTVGNTALDMGLSILDWQAEKVYNP